MAYEDYKWELADAPIYWSFAEIAVRFWIGAFWGVLVFWLVFELVGPGSEWWSTVAFFALILWGVELASPERRYDD